eukprot:TRINITY_DN46442_c0_g1_i1.p1 TRINITY_DN46442_c0_g1~~TRINITY_DN46442_c0_g1_i1.p1  ORF type:complete len:261 (+),score=60.16 TRINITY_DN46442_c0_g1_i1:91-873(+)
MGDEEEGPKFHKANLNDEFIRHPDSQAYIRNPFLGASKSTPILLQNHEFEFNCLSEALQDYHCIRVAEKDIKEMTMTGALLAAAAAGEGGDSAEATLNPQAATAQTLSSMGSSSPTMRGSTLARAALGRLRDLPSGFEYNVILKKSTYIVPRTNRRRPVEPRTPNGVLVDKVNVEVTDVDGKVLRVETINEGLVAVWNKNNPALPVQPGDCIIKVNDAPRTSTGMLEEIATAADAIKLTLRRAPLDRRFSKMSRRSSREV